MRTKLLFLNQSPTVYKAVSTRCHVAINLAFLSFLYCMHVVMGAVVGSYVWWRRPQNRLNAEEYIQYKAMLISLATHLLLLMFELLLADNLDTRRHLWILVRPIVGIGG